MTEQPQDAAWDLPFDRGEYDDRLRRVREEMGRLGLDLLYVTSPPNLYYLCGAEWAWYGMRFPSGLAVPRAEEPPLLFAPWLNQPFPLTVSEADTVAFKEESFPETHAMVARTLAARGWLRGRVGLEYWSRAQPYPNMAALREVMGDDGCAEVVDASFVVDRVRQLQSPRELAYTRTAIAIADAACEAVRDALAPGVTEKELMGLVYNEFGKLGGDEPAIRLMIHSGSRGDALHIPTRHRALRAGDLVMIQMGASYNCYHCCTGRAFSLGENPFWEKALADLAEGVERTTADIQPGTPTAELQRRMDAHIDAIGMRDHVWWVGGYTIGLAMPPDWVGHVYLDPAESPEEVAFEPGLVALWEVQFWDRAAHEGAGIVDTMIMTDGGIDIPAIFPRTLTLV
jgi:Xaa-Pro aminopeptidase